MTEETTPTPLELRRAEVAQYQKNIEMFQNILTTLPTEWPAHLLKYRGAKNPHDVISEVEDLQDVELLSKLWYADECQKFIRTETVEMTKAKSILTTMEATLNS